MILEEKITRLQKCQTKLTNTLNEHNNEKHRKL